MGAPACTRLSLVPPAPPSHCGPILVGAPTAARCQRRIADTCHVPCRPLVWSKSEYQRSLLLTKGLQHRERTEPLEWPVVGKPRLVSHMWLFGPLSVALPQNIMAWLALSYGYLSGQLAQALQDPGQEKALPQEAKI
ncbi:hypothetical protein QTO34_016885 [Cnephaeus nilssonii]|uniref:Uncharacterized protein n=1 Tax=Cnephaeus nilssonii TaxID=3371016 RepID=A0AA40I323_CNENI|nr:hypothetical protein QTO34_016885 [Eptesicus nilssonii]